MCWLNQVTAPLLSPAIASVLALGTGAPANPQAEAVREAARAATQRCLDRTQVGATRSVDRALRFLCRKDPADPAKNVYQGDTIAYSVTREEAGFRVRAAVDLRIQPASVPKARRELILQRTRECLPTIQQYWSRAGIAMDLDFTLSQGQDTPGTVGVADASGRSHSRLFYFKGLDNDVPLPTGQVIQGGPGVACVRKCRELGGGASCTDICEPLRQREYCMMMVHELGHRVGLPDEYAEPSLCPDREGVSTESYPWSIMAVPYLGILDTPESTLGLGLDSGLVEFFPRHVESVLSPLCP